MGPKRPYDCPFGVGWLTREEHLRCLFLKIPLYFFVLCFILVLFMYDSEYFNFIGTKPIWFH
jgi:hypothetical protein